MSNTRAWRSKNRTTTPNSRQKRNGLFLDAHRNCQRCRAEASEAHHELPVGHPDRYEWRFMLALCAPCHVALHRKVRVTVTMTSDC